MSRPKSGTYLWVIEYNSGDGNWRIWNYNGHETKDKALDAIIPLMDRHPEYDFRPKRYVAADSHKCTCGWEEGGIGGPR